MYSKNPYSQQGMYQNSSGYIDPYYPQKSFGYTANRGQNPYGQQPPQDEFIRDYHQKFDRTMNDFQTNGQMLSDLEFRLDEERKNMKNARQQLETNLDQERQMRIDFERKIISQRDEITQQQSIIQELEYKLSDTKMRNDSLEQENQAMRNEFIRGQEQYNQRLRELEDRCKQLGRQLQQNDEKFRIELDRILKQHDQKVSDMNQTFKIQREDSEAQIRSLKQQVQSLNQDLTNAMNENMRIRMEAEEEIRETVVRVQDEEMRKYLGHLRNIEQKLKASDEGRETLLRQNNELLGQIAEKDRLIKSKQMEFDQSFTRFKQEVSELDSQLKQTNLAREKMRNELQAKDQIIKTLQAEGIDLQRQNQKNREQQMQSFAEQQELNAQEKRQLEKEKDDMARKLNLAESTNRQMEDEIQRLKMQLEELGGQIHQNIERSIFQTINQTNFSSKFENRRPFQPQKYQ